MRIMILVATVFSCSLALAGSKAKVLMGLVGAWEQEGETHFVFKADGTGAMEDDAIRWSVEGQELVIKAKWGTQRLAYRIKDARLILTMGGEEQAFSRSGAKKSAAAAPSEAAQAPPKAEDRLSALLTSSAWCSFSYNKVSGASSSKRVSFSRDGSWSQGARSEGYSSGYGGTMASQHDSSGGGRWAVQGGQLLMSNPGEGAYELAPLGLVVKQNSNGSPILVADGVEYASCR